MLHRLPLPALLLRASVAFAFLYPALSALSDPDSWLGYFPAFVLSLFGNDLLALHVFGAVEVALALWILLARTIVIPAALAAVILVAIILFNLNEFPILFRDVSIALTAAALALINRKSNES